MFKGDYDIKHGDCLEVLKTLPDECVDASEVWKPVPFLRGICEVSNQGRVRTLDRIVKYSNGRTSLAKGRMKSIWKNKVTGYLNVTINEKNYTVHRLVAETFLSNPNNFPLVNHKDEDKTNNRVENLEWCTMQYNLLYSNVGEKSAKKSRKAIDVYDLDLNFIGNFKSRTEASKKLGVCLTCISACVCGSCGQAGGYIFVEKGSVPKPSISDFRVKQIEIKSGKVLAIYKSPTEASRILGYNNCNGIIAVCRNQSTQSHGYKWEYVSQIAKRGLTKKMREERKCIA